jgi:hypothetical protein
VEGELQEVKPIKAQNHKKKSTKEGRKNQKRE